MSQRYARPGDQGGGTFLTQRAKSGLGKTGGGGGGGGVADDETLSASIAAALRPGPPKPTPAGQPEPSKVTQSTLLAHKLREMGRVQAQLDSKKSEYHERMRTCRSGEAKLAEKQESIRASVVQFDKFVKDNDQKRRRANQLARDEVALTKQKQSEIESLRSQLAELVAKKEASETLLKRDEMYYQYFSRVCEFDKHATWESNEAIINRYAILEAANADLVEVAKEHDLEIERLKKALLDYTKTQTDEILFLNNQLTREQSRLDALRGESGDVEQRNSTLEADGNDKTRLLGQVRMAIANIHARAKPNVAVHRSNLAEMLEETKVRLSDLIYIEKLSREQQAASGGGQGDGQRTSGSLFKGPQHNQQQQQQQQQDRDNNNNNNRGGGAPPVRMLSQGTRNGAGSNVGTPPKAPAPGGSGGDMPQPPAPAKRNANSITFSTEAPPKSPAILPRIAEGASSSSGQPPLA